MKAINLSKNLIVKPGTKVNLSKYNPDDTFGFEDKQGAMDVIQRNTFRLGELQYLLYAENKHSLLIVLQAMDAGGKDGTVRHVMSGINPMGCTVTPFKVPSAEELDHDYLWRIHKAVPPKGEIGIFNRSHYEDVLVVRVRKLVPKPVWSPRYDQINAFENILAQNNVKIVKFFLHISKEEQKKRLQARLDDPVKHWKVAPGDYVDRKYWDEYMTAFEDVLGRCSTPWAPWYVIPANKKWFRNLAVSQILVEALEELNMKFPKPAYDISKIKLK